jgi:hypothetical protein
MSWAVGLLQTTLAPANSAVAGILDRYGGLRVVVTEPWRMRFHVRRGELLFVVPEFKIREPVPWDYIPILIRRVELYIEWWIQTRNDPDILRLRQIKNYIKNPNASHNLRPSEFKYLPGLVRESA